MNLFAVSLIAIMVFAVLDAVAAVLLVRMAIKNENPPLTLVERTFVQICIAVSASLVAIPTALALPDAISGKTQDIGSVAWLLVASILVKSLPTAYWAWLYLRNR